jgi:hypothetical protein
VVLSSFLSSWGKKCNFIINFIHDAQVKKRNGTGFAPLKKNWYFIILFRTSENLTMISNLVYFVSSVFKPILGPEISKGAPSSIYLWFQLKDGVSICWKQAILMKKSHVLFIECYASLYFRCFCCCDSQPENWWLIWKYALFFHVDKKINP